MNGSGSPFGNVIRCPRMMTIQSDSVSRQPAPMDNLRESVGTGVNLKLIHLRSAIDEVRSG